MDKTDEWNDFLDALYLRAMKSFEASKLFEYQKERQEQRKSLMDNLLVPSDRPVFEELSLEIWEDAEYRMRFLYQQGFVDCIRLLKSLGLFA